MILISFNKKKRNNMKEKILILLMICAFKMLHGQDSLVTSGSLYLNSNMSFGNVEQIMLNLGGNFNIESKQSEFFISPDYTYSEQLGVLVEDEYSLNVILETMKHRKIYLFGFAAIDKSFKRKFDLKKEVGIGSGHYFIKKDSNKVSFTTAITNESTDFYVVESEDVKVNRLSLRLKGSHMFKRFNVSYVFWYKPSLEFDGIYVYRNTLSFEFPMTENLSLNSQWSYVYDNLVVDDSVDEVDTDITFGIKYNF